MSDTERVVVSVVQIEIENRSRGDQMSVVGDTPTYWLPGADYDATITALRGAGFELVETIDDALHKAASCP